jgi:hypothetical protein
MAPSGLKTTSQQHSLSLGALHHPWEKPREEGAAQASAPQWSIGDSKARLAAGAVRLGAGVDALMLIAALAGRPVVIPL